MSEPQGNDADGTRKWPVIGVLLGILWLFVRGVHLDPRTLVGEFIIGLAVGLPLAYGTRRLYTDRVDLRRGIFATPWAIRYVVTFLSVLITANIDVAYRVLAPSMPIEPDVIAIPLRVERAAAITTIANSITLTPGTLTMDHDDETNTLYVHSLVARDVESVVGPIRTLEDYALRIFDESAQPTDPPTRQARSVADEMPGDWRGESNGG